MFGIQQHYEKKCLNWILKNWNRNLSAKIGRGLEICNSRNDELFVEVLINSVVVFVGLTGEESVLMWRAPVAVSCGLSVSLVLHHPTRRLSGAVVKNPRSGEGWGTGNGVGSWLQIPAQLFTLCVNLGKLISLFLVYFHHLWMRIIRVPTSGFLWEFNELGNVKVAPDTFQVLPKKRALSLLLICWICSAFHCLFYLQDDLRKEDFSSMSAQLLYKMIKSKTEYPLHKAIKVEREDVVFLYLIEMDSQVLCLFPKLHFTCSSL